MRISSERESDGLNLLTLHDVISSIMIGLEDETPLFWSTVETLQTHYEMQFWVRLPHHRLVYCCVWCPAQQFSAG